MRALRFLLVLGCLGVAAIVDAGLTPTKGSQLVALAAAGQCAIPGRPDATGFFRVGGDGALTPFTIPPKQILVVTDVVASASFLVAGDVFFMTVLVGNGTSSNVVTGSIETASASGVFSRTYAPTNGIVVKSGSVLCIEADDLTHPGPVGVFAFAHGFLAADK
jgi:hypothetical protein